ncbi:peptidoglycan recognition protein-like [Macrosteles quadrilineatus]|uniref:peptidoglycan recognition protein-like n=1 Tax=Macrosteles quadrilineatus TaxID=74068 RepID=UPI0023E0949E|nr:peptidoglycan recognition protein-like [Macrosteles quadrilineatus]
MNPNEESDLTNHPINETFEQRGYITRHEWGARPPIRVKKLVHPVPYVCISYNDTTHPHSKEFIKQTQQAHIERGMWDIQSNFIVTIDGTLYEGRGWDIAPSRMFEKLAKYNGKFFEVSVLGRLPGPAKQDDPFFKEILTLISYGMQSNKISLSFEFIQDKEGLLMLDPAQRHSLPPKEEEEIIPTPA